MRGDLGQVVGAVILQQDYEVGTGYLGVKSSARGMARPLTRHSGTYGSW